MHTHIPPHQTYHTHTQSLVGASSHCQPAQHTNTQQIRGLDKTVLPTYLLKHAKHHKHLLMDYTHTHTHFLPTHSRLPISLTISATRDAGKRKEPRTHNRRSLAHHHTVITAHTSLSASLPPHLECSRCHDTLSMAATRTASINLRFNHESLWWTLQP